MSTRDKHGRAAARAANDGGQADLPETVLWHDLECGGYAADLPLWRELAADARDRGGAAAGAVLDVGAGTGRVSLDLAARGHPVTALELDPQLAEALRARAAVSGAAASGAAAPGAAYGRIAVVEGDARRLGEIGEPGLPAGARFALCIVAMQTLQLLGGAGGRADFLRGVRPLLDAGAVVACAIVGGLESFDADRGDAAPAPERARTDGREYASRAVRVAGASDGIVIERERVVRDLHSATVIARARHATALDVLSAAQLGDEARAAGLRPLGLRAVPDTTEHVGSTVVILGG